MPNARKNDAIARQWELLKLLPSRGSGKSARELCESLTVEGFTVTKRTVERDLQELSVLFPIESNDKAKPFGWRWMTDAEIDLPSLAVSEALSLRLLAQYLTPLLPASMLRTLQPRFRLAETKLAALGTSNRASRWAEKVRSVSPTLSMIPPQVTAAVLDAVQDALLEDRQLAVQYHAAEADVPSNLTLHPLALVQRGPVTYLVATVFQYSDARLFALHRLLSAEVCAERSRRTKGFAIDDYIASGAMDFGAGAQLTLVAEIDPGLAKLLTETPLSRDMNIRTTATVQLTATVTDSWQLRWWILSQGDTIKVMEPATLQNEIATTLGRAAHQYDQQLPRTSRSSET